MSKKISKAQTVVSKKQTKEPVKLIYIFLLISYGFVTVLTPNLMALDSNGPKFLTLSLLNLLSFIILFTSKDLKNNSAGYTSFLKNGIGIAYFVLILLSLLSFI